MFFEIKDWKLIWNFKNLSNWIYEYKELWNNRTTKQNALYFQYLSDIVKCFAEKWIFITHEELHEGLRDKLIKWTYEINKITKRRITKRKSTTKLSKKEFNKYIEDIERYLRQEHEISYMLATDIWYIKK